LHQNRVKIVVAGNATLDLIIEGSVSVIGDNTVIVDSRGILESFRVEDPPIRPGHKHRVNQNIGEKVMPLWHCAQPGGGGYNSATAMQRLPEIEKEIDLAYIDVSTPRPLNIKGLREYGVDPHFFYERDVPANAILKWMGDKITLKGPQLGRVDPNRDHIEEVKKLLSGADAFLINSFKDSGYVDEFIRLKEERNIPTYCAFTASLESDFIYGRVLPQVVGIFNYDEIPVLKGVTKSLDEQAKLEFAKETLKQIRMDGINSSHPIFMTLGKNGVYYSDGPSSIWHLGLSPDAAEKVNNGGRPRMEGTNGAGDVFSAAITAYRTLNPEIHIRDLARKASQAAIRHIGYNGPLAPSAFTYTQHEIGRLIVVHSR